MTGTGAPLIGREPAAASADGARPPIEGDLGPGVDYPVTGFIRDFCRYARPQAPKALFFLALGAAVEGIGLVFLVPLLSVVLGTGSGSPRLDRLTEWLVSFAPAGSQIGKLSLVLILFGLVVIARGFIIKTRDVLLANLQVGFIEAQRLRMVELLASSRWELTTRLRHGRIMHVLGADLEACGDAAALLLHATVALTLVAGQVLLMFFLSPKLAAFILVLLFLGAVTIRPLLNRAQRLGQSLTSSNLQLVTGTSQFLGGLKLALSHDLQLGFLRRFQSTLAAAAQRRVDFVRQRTEVQLLVTTAGAVVASLVILVGVGIFNAAAATLLAFLFILSRMVPPLNQIQMGMQQVFHSLPAYRAINELQAELAAAQRERAAPGQRPQALPDGPIRFEGVAYHHGDFMNGRGLQDLNMAIERGSFIGLVGPSGAGKTTVCDLLVGLYPPKRGTISVGGLPLQGSALSAWRSSLSYVSQDPFLFHDTIRSNLLWASPEAGEAELWAALELAGAQDFVRSLDRGLETLVGERGVLMSGGERQRLALARGLLRKPILLVLDEATNAIDVAAERDLLERLSAMPNRPTIIMVAHRETSLQLCERLIELRDGRLVTDDGRQ